MIEQIYTYFSVEMLYFWVNLGVLPFWLTLIFFPRSYLTKFFITSIFPILILSGTYIFVIYKSFLSSYNFLENFSLYMGINDLSELFSSELFLITFWIHFVSINLFVGGWIVKDAEKFNINKILIIIPLILTYLIGPLGLFLYWVIRIFHAKSMSFYD